ncbi:MAG: hypothetical protein ACFFE6_09130 [Candidatus Thorarchaeota archaeon]
MSNESVETGKVLGSIYGSLIILLAVLLFMSSIFSGLLPDAALRSYFIIYFVGTIIVFIGAELARVLLKSGITVVGFFVFLIMNLLMVIFAVALFADIVTTDPFAIQLLLFLLIGAVAWYIVLILLSIRDWRKSR